MYRILDDCIQNAVAKGHSRLMPAHFRRLDYNYNYRYYEPDNDDYAIKESIWMDHDEELREQRDNAEAVSASLSAENDSMKTSIILIYRI